MQDQMHHGYRPRENYGLGLLKPKTSSQEGHRYEQRVGGSREGGIPQGTRAERWITGKSSHASICRKPGHFAHETADRSGTAIKAPRTPIQGQVPRPGTLKARNARLTNPSGRKQH
jgi:hypothetical protein